MLNLTSVSFKICYNRYLYNYIQSLFKPMFVHNKHRQIIGYRQLYKKIHKMPSISCCSSQANLILYNANWYPDIACCWLMSRIWNMSKLLTFNLISGISIQWLAIEYITINYCTILSAPSSIPLMSFQGFAKVFITTLSTACK